MPSPPKDTRCRMRTGTGRPSALSRSMSKVSTRAPSGTGLTLSISWAPPPLTMSVSPSAPPVVWARSMPSQPASVALRYWMRPFSSAEKKPAGAWSR
jgi:hypothetical protein